MFSSGNNTTFTFTMPSDEVIITRDVTGILIDYEGKPKRKYGLNWNEIPNAIGYVNPYLFCCLKDTVEVRMLRTSTNGTLVQTIPLSGILTCSQESYIDVDMKRLHGMREKMKEYDNNDEFDVKQRMFFAAKHKIYLICLKKFQSQIDQMQKNYNFEDALNLCETLKESNNFEIDEWRIENIHLEYAFHLFKLGDYKNASHHFINTRTDPRIPISLIPNLLIDENFAKSFAHEDMTSIHKILEDPSQLNKALSSIRTFLTKVRIPVTEAKLNPEEEKISECIDSALLRVYLETQPTLLSTFLKIPSKSLQEV
jgi:hypothetical protein